MPDPGTVRTPLSLPLPVARAEPDLSPVHKAAVIAAIRWAWAELCRPDPQAVAHMTEESVTTALQRLLNDQHLGQRRAAWIEEFETVTRGEKQVTNDGRIEKQPDLVFRPPRYRDVRQLSDWGWFVECKWIDGAGSVDAYCVQGVRRFSSGEYGARMQSGVMMAYVRDRQVPWPALNPRLVGRFGLKAHDRGESTDMSLSRHDRARLTPPAVDIALVHLWLAVPPGVDDNDVAAPPPEQ